MDETRALALGIALPVVLGLVALLVVWWPSARRGQQWGSDEAAQRADRRRALWSSVVLAVLWTLSVLAGFGVPGWPPGGSKEVLPLLLVAMGLMALGVGVPRIGVICVLLCPVALGVGLWALSRNLVKNSWNVWEATGWVGGATVLIALAWSAMGKAGRSRGWYAPLLLIGVGVCASVSVVLTGHITPALMAGGLCGVLGGAVVAGVVRPRLRLGAGVGLAAAALGVLMYFAVVFGDTPVACGVLVVLAACAAGLVSPDDTAGAIGIKDRLVRAAVPAALGLASIVVAVLNQPKPYGV